MEQIFWSQLCHKRQLYQTLNSVSNVPRAVFSSIYAHRFDIEVLVIFTLT